MTKVERIELGPGYEIPRLIVGGWQLSAGHQSAPVDRRTALDTLCRCVDHGLTTFDCADIYTGADW